MVCTWSMSCNKGVPAQAPLLSFCRLETTVLIMYFAPITGALAGLPSNFGIQGPAAGSWPQLGIQSPGAGPWPQLAIQSPGAPYLPLEIRREGQLRRRDPSTDTEALEHRLRRRRREKPVVDDATRPVGTRPIWWDREHQRKVRSLCPCS